MVYLIISFPSLFDTFSLPFCPDTWTWPWTRSRNRTGTEKESEDKNVKEKLSRPFKLYNLGRGKPYRNGPYQDTAAKPKGTICFFFSYFSTGVLVTK